jgi:hypothetical protein
MATAVEAEVRSIITEDREARINRAYAKAWNDWWENPNRQTFRWARSRANDLFEYLARHLANEFSTDTGVRFIYHRESFKLIMDERLIVRFKKANMNGVGSNIATEIELDFCELQTDLPGFPGLQKVEIVYELNVTETAISDIAVVARNGEKRFWSYSIPGTGGAEVIPLVQPTSPTPDIDNLVVPKTPSSDEMSRKGDK